MSYQDTIKLSTPKLKKGEAARRSTVTVEQAQASLDRGLKEISKIYGFPLVFGDPRFSITSSYRAGTEAFVTYGMKGRQLDAAALAYELNN